MSVTTHMKGIRLSPVTIAGKYSISCHQQPYLTHGLSQIHTAATFYKIQVKVKSKPSIMTRRLHNHWMIGISTSVLNYEFTTSYKHGDDVEVGPFSGRLMLPTKLQVLKLHLFFRDEAGKKNQNVSKCEVTAKVLLESC